jgi:DNA-binding transcriptional MerR regulator
VKKSRDAFRTISEVAEWLDVPTHVLRFWESRFTQVKPVKRAGGRRYYRPKDMLLIGGIKKLLHDDGMTIRGVQKLLRDEGIGHVSSFSKSLDAGLDIVEADDRSMIEGSVATDEAPSTGPKAEPEVIRSSADVGAAKDDADTSELVYEPDPSATQHDTDEPSHDVAEDAEGDDASKPEVTNRPGKIPPAPVSEPTFGSSRRETEASDDHVDELAPVEAKPVTIQTTANIPDVDASDDDLAFATGPGIAARIVAADRAGLVSTANKLRPVHAKLSDLFARASARANG